VFADRIMIEQVLLNLVKNGIEAMHHQGRLWVEPRREGGTVFRFTVPIEENDA
jgi:signal transduction histidine kinase